VTFANENIYVPNRDLGYDDFKIADKDNVIKLSRLTLPSLRP
jgi:hypothetical protein